MSEDVSKFLSQVKELGERRIEEDRELEEKILQEKKERQARRLERARSISPQKSSPVNKSRPTSTRASALQDAAKLNLESSPVLEPPTSPPSQAAEHERAMAALEGTATSPSKENESPLESEPKTPGAGSLQRSKSAARGLSWQRRPNSQAPGNTSQSRPLSMMASENTARSTNAPSEPTSNSENMSRSQIASALAGKDPAWFRQTADRGLNSAAYRRNQVEDGQRTDVHSSSAQLPGMSRNNSHEQNAPEPDVTESPKPEPSVSRPLSTPQRLDPPVDEPAPEQEVEDNSVMSPPSSRASPTRGDRPVSPTKGMGGFVQSAMMKRSDSVQKRWSVKSPPGLQRGDSISSPRRGGRSRPTSVVRAPADEASARPTSSQGEEQLVSEQIKQALQLDTNTSPDPEPQESDKVTPPTSPSKTMDPRRWSPTKSSWLESALNKPESPKPKPAPAVSNQPAWMVELQKAKERRATGAEPSKPATSHKHQVSIGGLMRSTAPGVSIKPPTLGNLSGPTVPTTTTDNRPPWSRSRGISQVSPTTADDNKPFESTAKSPVEVPSPLESKSLESKAKPETPPKKDFRSNLKHRQTPSTSSAGAQDPEFKSVFGHLRKATTQNYKAPDELKDNILRGKAGLNMTGGPQKSEIRDEFKDAILAKKKSFSQTQAEGRGVTRTNSTASQNPVPEGLLRRGELGRSKSFKRGSVSENNVVESESPSAAAKPERLSRFEKQDPVSDPPMSKPESPVDTPKDTGAPAKLPGKIGGSALANRFNPGLAGLLARGPPGMAPGSGGSAGVNPSAKSPSAGDEDKAPGPGPKLTHMTKGRARGPKRKAPTTALAPTIATGQATQKPASPQPEKASSPEAAEPESAPSPVSPPNESADSTPKTKTATKAVNPRQSVFGQVAALAARRQPSPTKPAESAESTQEEAGPQTPKEAPSTKPKPTLESPISLGTPQAQPESPAPEKSPKPSPHPKPSFSLDRSLNGKGDAESPAPSPRVTPRFGPRPLPTASAASSQPESPVASPRPFSQSRPLPKPGSNPGLSDAPPAALSPNKPASDLTTALNDIFGPSRPERHYKVDAVEVLSNKPDFSAPKIKTQSVQLFQFSSDGKKVPVPAHRERTLFEREMYICAHTFENEAGKVSEVYFWVGDEVPQSAAEDASIFVTREAKALGGTLVKMQQNKETPEFLQALGGIVITQRGSGNKYDSLAPHMLCGRRYRGHVVFDEVDFTPSSLCSGFAYLVTQAGRCSLWKGKGAGIDELSCARLIAMDHALSGELEEVDDGDEPSAFWAMFEGAAKSGSADHWRLKPNYDKYCSRLFVSDNATKSQISEIPFFAQRDLSATGIYVVDAFFELYIVVGAQARTGQHYASFHNALDFAQEYSMMAASMEDRPFMPISTVVLEGIPRDLKSVFRKWRDSDSPTAAVDNGPSSGVKRGRSLRVVSLTQALQAMSE